MQLTLAKKILIALMAILISGGLILSIPILNMLLVGTMKKPDENRRTELVIRKVDIKEQKKKKHRRKRKPQRSRPSHRSPKAGSRFAMELGVAGSGGGVVAIDLVNRKGVPGAGGDVDKKPRPQSPPPFRLPSGIRKAEADAYLLLSFCVDPAGRVYDIRTLDERPAGLGMELAGRTALSNTRFDPAMKDGLPVAFCGLEQPFEIKYSN